MMEKIGAINKYVPYPVFEAYDAIFTINLANGVTPFFHLIEGKEYASSHYIFSTRRGCQVTYGHYRPDKEEFAALDEAVQDHILNGGLLIAPLKEAVGKQLITDTISVNISFHRFQVWCKLYYGKYKSGKDV